MKIVLMSFRIDRAGGAAEVPRMLARELASRGWNVSVVTTGAEPRGPFTHPDGWTQHTIRPWNLYLVGDKDTKPTWQRMAWQSVDMWNPHAYRLVATILDRTRPDLVHVHKLRGLSSAVWSAVRRHGRDLPLVQTCHDYEAISPEGTLTSAVGRLAARGGWPLAPYQKVRAIASRVVDVVTAPTDFTLQTVTRRGLFANADRRTVPNSHGLSNRELGDVRSHRAVGARGSEVVSFLYLGRLEATKGVATLCRAFDTASRDEPRIRLTVAGWGALGEALQDEYRGHPRIRFAGMVDGERKARLLEESDAIVVPSEWPEVFGIVVAEGLAYGCPAIAARVGGLPEVVEDGRTGILIESGDEVGLSALLADLGKHPERLREMRDRCFDAARSFSVEAIVERYQTSYQRALERHVS